MIYFHPNDLASNSWKLRKLFVDVSIFPFSGGMKERNCLFFPPSNGARRHFGATPL
jgi:hypothetical protein